MDNIKLKKTIDELSKLINISEEQCQRKKTLLIQEYAKIILRIIC